MTKLHEIALSSLERVYGAQSEYCSTALSVADGEAGYNQWRARSANAWAHFEKTKDLEPWLIVHGYGPGNRTELGDKARWDYDKALYCDDMKRIRGQ